MTEVSNAYETVFVSVHCLSCDLCVTTKQILLVYCVQFLKLKLKLLLPLEFYSIQMITIVMHLNPLITMY
jgi:hypothetical protein